MGATSFVAHPPRGGGGRSQAQQLGFERLVFMHRRHLVRHPVHRPVK